MATISQGNILPAGKRRQSIVSFCTVLIQQYRLLKKPPGLDSICQHGVTIGRLYVTQRC